MTTKRKSSFRGKVGADSKRQQTAATSYGHLLLKKGTSVFSVEPGSKNVLLDFLPYEVTDKKHPDKNADLGIAMVGDLWYKRPYWIHRNVGAENETVVCLASIKKPCPICENRAKMAKEGAEQEDLKVMNRSQRNLYNIVPLNSKDNEAVPHVLDIAQTLLQDLLNDELEENEEFEVFPDLEEGFTLKIRFSKEKIGKNVYAEAKKIEFVDREEQYTEDILSDVANLDEMLKVYSYNELKAKFFEEEEEDDAGKLDDVDDDDDDEKPTRKKAKKPVHKRPAKDDDDNEEDAEEDEEDDEEEEKTKKRVTPKSKHQVDDDDDDDDDTDDDDEPVRKRKSTRKVEDEDEDEEEEKPARNSVKRNSSSKTSSTKKVCPHGHKFGRDNDQFKECPNCKIWDACNDASN